MVIVTFTNPEQERHALGYVVGRFPFKTWHTGELMVPEAALQHLAAQDIHFTVTGRPAYERSIPQVRGSLAAAV